MDYEVLQAEVYQANKEIVRVGLVVLTWGNVSGVDRQAGVMAIKPSGIEYDKLQPKDIVILSLATGEIVEGSLHPSSDTPTHLLLYQEFSSIGGIVHTHSTYATSWAQAGQEIPCRGTTHADHFYGPVPVTRQLIPEEINNNYELNTGKIIVERFQQENINLTQIPAVLVKGHGPFSWGKSVKEAVQNAIVLEEVAKIALIVTQLNPEAKEIPQVLQDKHFFRKHGANAYYGQKNKSSKSTS